ncbi:MAG TPA: hypothetical protein VK163_08450 [Opitutaceae bacterium]|nr:hypothetical protein [Opitutaceae bacterium]
MSDHRPLMMRANRALGSSLVDHNLITIEALDAANERLLELTADEKNENVSLLHILVYEKQSLTEEQLLAYEVEEMGLGMVDLSSYDQPYDLRKKLDVEACTATWTVPFDVEEGTHFLATAYYLSPAVRSFWERQLETPILWFVTSMENINDFLRKLAVERENEGSNVRAN